MRHNKQQKDIPREKRRYKTLKYQRIYKIDIFVCRVFAFACLIFYFVYYFRVFALNLFRFRNCSAQRRGCEIDTFGRVLMAAVADGVVVVTGSVGDGYRFGFAFSFRSNVAIILYIYVCVCEFGVVGAQSIRL